MSNHVSNDQEVQSILDNTKLVFVKWGADFCGPCRTIQPFYDQLAEQHKSKAAFLSLETDNPAFEKRVIKNNISSIPLFQLYVNGKLNKSILGAKKSELTTFIDNGIEEK
jgi:thioredoxin 1